jgi:hypothetical protein
VLGQGECHLRRLAGRPQCMALVTLIYAYIASRKIICSNKAMDRSCRFTATAISTPENTRIKINGDTATSGLTLGAPRTSIDRVPQSKCALQAATHSELGPIIFIRCCCCHHHGSSLMIMNPVPFSSRFVLRPKKCKTAPLWG